MSEVAHHIYTTPWEARAISAEFGCEEFYHTQVIEGVTYYMPCADFTEYTTVVGDYFNHVACNDCCGCGVDEILLTHMWDCKYLKVAQTFLTNSYYGEKCLEDTIDKLHTWNAMFWLFQTNNAPEYTLNKYNSETCTTTLNDTFAHTLCTEVTCELIQKFDDMIGSCCELQQGETFGYCQLSSTGAWSISYNNGLGYNIGDIVSYGELYWSNTMANNVMPPTNNPRISGWEPCIDMTGSPKSGTSEVSTSSNTSSSSSITGGGKTSSGVDEGETSAPSAGPDPEVEGGS